MWLCLLVLIVGVGTAHACSPRIRQVVRDRPREAYIAFLHHRLHVLEHQLQDHHVRLNQAYRVCEARWEQPPSAPTPPVPKPIHRPTLIPVTPVTPLEESIQPAIESKPQSSDPLGGTTLAVVVVLILVPVAVMIGVLLLYRRRH